MLYSVSALLGNYVLKAIELRCVQRKSPDFNVSLIAFQFCQRNVKVSIIFGCVVTKNLQLGISVNHGILTVSNRHLGSMHMLNCKVVYYLEYHLPYLSKPLCLPGPEISAELRLRTDPSKDVAVVFNPASWNGRECFGIWIRRCSLTISADPFPLEHLVGYFTSLTGLQTSVNPVQNNLFLQGRNFQYQRSVAGIASKVMPGRV